jgi:hypothetical protein
MLEVLELGARRREQLLAQLDMRVHRAADVEEQQQLDRIVPLGPHVDVEPALAGGAVDRLVEVELVGGAFAGEAAQAPQRDLDVAGAELDGSSRSRNSRLSQTLIARPCGRPPGRSARPSGL